MAIHKEKNTLFSHFMILYNVKCEIFCNFAPESLRLLRLRGPTNDKRCYIQCNKSKKQRIESMDFKITS